MRTARQVRLVQLRPNDPRFKGLFDEGVAPGQEFGYEALFSNVELSTDCHGRCTFVLKNDVGGFEVKIIDPNPAVTWRELQQAAEYELQLAEGHRDRALGEKIRSRASQSAKKTRGPRDGTREVLELAALYRQRHPTDSTRAMSLRIAAQLGVSDQAVRGALRRHARSKNPGR